MVYQLTVGPLYSRGGGAWGIEYPYRERERERKKERGKKRKRERVNALDRSSGYSAAKYVHFFLPRIHRFHAFVWLGSVALSDR
jgi:hypothetical protein